MDSPQRWLIVADDLTGALDTAAPFAVGGRSVLVVTNQLALADAIAGDADVVTLTTRSREIEPDEAAQRVGHAHSLLPGGMRLFKKVDSRLKGNVDVELAALGTGRLLVLPAIPEFGRIVENGMIDGFGVTVPISIAERLGDAAARAKIPDTRTPADMLAALDAAEIDDLLVGALSLAKAVALQCGLSPHAPPPKLGERLIMAIGSRDPITMAQIARLKSALPDLACIPVRGGTPSLDEARSVEDGAKFILVQAVEGDFPAGETDVARALADTVSALSVEGDTILLSGGASAEAFFDRQNIHIMTLVGEILPGLPVAQHDGRFYITKSGGFGEPDTLVRLTEFLEAKASN